MGGTVFANCTQALVDDDGWLVIRDQVLTAEQPVAFSRQVRWKVDDRTHL
jgi:hypothetical protein